LELLPRAMLVRRARLRLRQAGTELVDLGGELGDAALLARGPARELRELGREPLVLRGQRGARRLGTPRRLDGTPELQLARARAALDGGLELLAGAVRVRRAGLRLRELGAETVDLRSRFGVAATGPVALDLGLEPRLLGLDHGARRVGRARGLDGLAQRAL